MNSFKLSVKVNFREKPDYAHVQSMMRSNGFRPVGGKRSGIMRYTYVGDLTLETAYESAVEILSRMHTKFIIFVHEVDGKRGMGSAN